MSKEYLRLRLRDASREVDREIGELEERQQVNSAAELAAIERRLDELTFKRGSLAKGLVLLRSVASPQLRKKLQEFIEQLPHKYHSHGTRPKVVHLPGGVDVTLSVTYFPRQKDPAKASRKPQRGLFPALMLLGISQGLTPHVRQRMAKASALLGAYDFVSHKRNASSGQFTNSSRPDGVVRGTRTFSRVGGRGRAGGHRTVRYADRALRGRAGR